MLLCYLGFLLSQASSLCDYLWATHSKVTGIIPVSNSQPFFSCVCACTCMIWHDVCEYECMYMCIYVYDIAWRVQICMLVCEHSHTCITAHVWSQKTTWESALTFNFVLVFHLFVLNLFIYCGVRWGEWGERLCTSVYVYACHGLCMENRG